MQGARAHARQRRVHDRCIQIKSVYYNCLKLKVDKYPLIWYVSFVTFRVDHYGKSTENIKSAKNDATLNG